MTGFAAAWKKEYKEEGRKLERKDTIKRLLAKFSPAEISALMGYPIDEVESVAKET